DIGNCNFLVFFGYNFNSSFLKYGELALLNSLIEIGCMSHNFGLVITSLGYTGLRPSLSSLQTTIVSPDLANSIALSKPGRLLFEPLICSLNIFLISYIFNISLCIFLYSKKQSKSHTLQTILLYLNHVYYFFNLSYYH